jgi:cytochrome P450
MAGEMSAALKRPPLVHGLPFVGSAFAMNADLLGFLVQAYRQHGPVFRTRVFGRERTVMAGPAANLFASRRGAQHFSSYEAWAPLGAEYGAPEYVQSVDGEKLARYRQAFKRGYSPGLMGRNIPLLVRVEQDVLSRRGGDVEALDLFQRIVTEQLGQALTGHRVGEDIEVVRRFIHTALNVHVIGRLPHVVLRSRRYLQARERLFEMARSIVDSHRSEARDEPDLVDDVLLAAEAHPDLFGSEGQVLTAVLGPFIAGLDTVANACTFMTYELMRNDDVAHACRDEADRLFAAGVPTASAMEDAETIRSAMMETLRLHPIAPGISRTVTAPFEFEGHQVPSGTTVLVAMAVSHLLSELFPEPGRFDVGRFAESRQEHKQPGAYVPFGVGAHTCLGAGAAQVQIMTVIATLLHHCDLAWYGPKGELPVHPNPTLTLGSRFRIELRARTAGAV